MATVTTTPPSLDGYQLRLPTFEGPLDVLLRLIERDQLDISEISLLAVLDQFVAYMEALDSTAPEAIAEFVAVAGRLSVLKSRSLLPRPAKSVDEPDEIDLVRQLEEYRAVKAAAELLANRQHAGSGAFGPGEGIATPPIGPVHFAPQPPSALAKAVSRWLARVPTKPVLIPSFRVVSFREMIARIISMFDPDTAVSFDRIRETCASREESAVAFLAMLTLMRRRAITATQSELFGSITLFPAESEFKAEPETTPEDVDSKHVITYPIP